MAMEINRAVAGDCGGGRRRSQFLSGESDAIVPILYTSAHDAEGCMSPAHS